MNQSVVHQSSSAVQQMMMAATGNPNFFTINHRKPPQPPSTTTHQSPPPLFPPHYTPTSSSSSSSSSSFHEEFPESWSQLLLGRLVEESSWEEQVIQQHQISSNVNVKQENNNLVYGCTPNEVKPTCSWSQLIIPPPLPTNNNMLDFSAGPPECNSNGVMNKKARVQPSSSSSATSQSNTTSKVKKEKLGDRITALHQLVSPFGKTDTASVLLEAIGYIRFLQSQIEALSLPYLGTGSPNLRQQQPVQAERNSIFPEDPGQLLNDNCLKKRKGASSDLPQETQEGEVKRDLRSRGLCLVPVSCPLQVGSENGADYWAPAFAGFR